LWELCPFFNTSNAPSADPDGMSGITMLTTMYPWANLEVVSQLGTLTTVFSLAIHPFLCPYLSLSYIVQQEGRGHRKKSTRRMQEVIEAEIAETAREAAEKRGRRPRISLQLHSKLVMVMVRMT
jgi:hypothetical protein